jgi:hypothetical protein
MKFEFRFKSITALLFLSALTCSVKAQKINEQDLKVKVAGISSPTARLMTLKPVTFQYDNKKFGFLKLPEGNQFGFITASVQPVFPDLVAKNFAVYSLGKNNTVSANYDDVDHQKLIPVLVAAIQEQQEEINLLKKEIEQLKDKKAD